MAMLPRGALLLGPRLHIPWPGEKHCSGSLPECPHPLGLWLRPSTLLCPEVSAHPQEVMSDRTQDGLMLVFPARAAPPPASSPSGLFPGSTRSASLLPSWRPGPSPVGTPALGLALPMTGPFAESPFPCPRALTYMWVSGPGVQKQVSAISLNIFM